MKDFSARDRHETFTVARAEPKRCPSRYPAGASLRFSHQPPPLRRCPVSVSPRLGVWASSPSSRLDPRK